MDTTLDAAVTAEQLTTSPWRRGSVARALSRIFSRHFMHCAVLLIVPVLFAQPLQKPIELLRDPDLWWHLADARILFSTHHFISVEPYSFTVLGQRWINPEWLSEIPYYLAYNVLHLSGIYLVTWLALGANLLFLYWRSYWNTGHSGAAFWSACLGFALMTVNSGPRTIILGYFALSAELAIIEALERGMTRIAWLLPPIFCVWINLHGSWLIGFALFVLYVLLSGHVGVFKGSFEQPPCARVDQKRLHYVFLASLGALLLNPNGWRLIWNPFDMMLNQKLNIAYIQEWQPLNLEWFAGKAAAAAIAIMVLSHLLRGRKWKLYEIAFIAFAWYAAFDHARFAFLAAVITTPFLAADMKRCFCSRTETKTIPAMNAIFGAAAIWIMVIMFPGKSDLQQAFTEDFPCQTIQMLDSSWHTLNVTDVGGPMAFYSKASFIDSRLDTFEHHGVLADYIDTVQIRRPLEVLDHYRIDHVLFPDRSPLAYLLRHSIDWRIVRQEGSGDRSYVLFARNAKSK